MSNNNKSLSAILNKYQKEYTSSIQYPLFNIIVLAFLKENNETLDTLEINNEFRQELFLFTQHIICQKDTTLKHILKQYNTS